MKRHQSKKKSDPIFAPQTPQHSHFLTYSCAIGLLSFFVYFLTLFPTVSGGDSGELITVAHGMGIAHPPGYPLYTLLGKLFTFIPYGSIAWRVNLLSAVAQSGSLVLVALLVSEWTASPWAGFLSSGLFAFSPLAWTYATQAEVFSLNLFFEALLLLLFYRWHQTRKQQLLYWGAFAFGLGMSHHHTLLFIGLPLAGYAFFQIRHDPSVIKLASKCIGVFCLGLIPYIYLPIAYRLHSTVAWGDFSSLSGFFTHLLRSEYGSFQLKANGEEGKISRLFINLWAYLSSLPRETLFGGVVLIAFGIFRIFQVEDKKWGFGKSLLICLGGYLVVFHSLANLDLTAQFWYGIHQRFWLLPNLIAFVLLGFGYAEFCRKQNIKKSIHATIAIILVLVEMTLHYTKQDQHQNFLYANFGKLMLNSFPPSSLFLSKGDIYTNTTEYLQECEGVRRDVMILDRGLFPAHWYRTQKGLKEGTLKAILDDNRNRRFLFICNMTPDESNTIDWTNSYSSWPYGVVNWIVPTGSFQFENYVKKTDEISKALGLEKLPKGDLDPWEYYIRNEFLEVDHRRGRRILSLGIETQRTDLIQLSARIMQGLLDQHPTPPPALYKNLGYAYSRLSTVDRNAGPLMVKTWGKYLEVAPPDDHDLDTIRNAIKK